MKELTRDVIIIPLVLMICFGVVLIYLVSNNNFILPLVFVIIFVSFFIFVLIYFLYYVIKLRKVIENDKLHNKDYKNRNKRNDIINYYTRQISFYGQYIYTYKNKLLLIKYLILVVILIMLISGYFFSSSI